MPSAVKPTSVLVVKRPQSSANSSSIASGGLVISEHLLLNNSTTSQPDQNVVFPSSIKVSWLLFDVRTNGIVKILKLIKVLPAKGSTKGKSRKNILIVCLKNVKNGTCVLVSSLQKGSILINECQLVRIQNVLGLYRSSKATQVL